MNEPRTPVRQRLIQAALECFLADEYQNVTTRMIAARAEANVSMIRYYFGNKQGLFEESIRETLAPVLDSLDGPLLADTGGFAELLQLYYKTINEHPAFPRLILKILALNQGPGRGFLQQLLHRGRNRGARRIQELEAAGVIRKGTDPEILRLSFVSLAMMPMLLKDIFEEQTGQPMDDAFLDKLARFNGHLITAGLTTATIEQGEDES